MKVLLVDDSSLSRKVQSKVLKQVGVDTIVEAENGQDALKRLGELGFAVDLIVTDWNMPTMDGIGLIQEVRRTAKGRALPIIVVSGEGEEERIAQAFAVGASSYVTKPFKKEVLARKIETVRSIAMIQREERPLIEGDFERLGLAELVGFLNFGKKTGELVIERASGAAGLSLAGGEVKHAWLDGQEGEPAFLAIASLRAGRFRFHEGRPLKAATITRGTMSLLMEAMRILDEGAAGE